MADSDQHSLPLCEKIHVKVNTVQRALTIVTLFLLFCLPVYRLLSLIDHDYQFTMVLHLLGFWPSFVSLGLHSIGFSPSPSNGLLWNTKHTLTNSCNRKVAELPLVDMFVTTADPVLEPPMVTVNTVLSLLAVDYPPQKLACYVSDDGCSPLTLYSLIEASKFATLWVPFCKKHNIQVRAPFRYFSAGESTFPSDDSPPQYLLEWTKVKDEYEKLCQRIEDAVRNNNLVPRDFCEDYEAFAHSDSTKHPSVIKVIWENNKGLPNGLPHFVYVAREKRPNHPHHYKAGALNALSRVSGVMTNAPFMLNVDCDMYVNNPNILLHAMCLLLGFKHESEGAFVQCPQLFYDNLKDDPFGINEAVALKIVWPGLAGIQGPIYAGTGCFHRRKVIYGSLPHNTDNEGNLTGEEVKERFGDSMEFIRSTSHILSQKIDLHHPRNLSNVVEVACQVAGCGYEHNTLWGTKVGWAYGSATEDVLTGMKIHARGWKSILCTAEPPGFMGSTPSAANLVLAQRKRWVAGLLQILLTKDSPIFATLYANLQFRQCLAYTWLLIWALISIPNLCYALLPAYSIITNSHFLPKVQEPGFIMFAAVFLIKNLCTLHSFLRLGLSIRAWWNSVRVGPNGLISSATALLLGLITVALKLMGISEAIFEVTQKDQYTPSNQDDVHAGTFTFDESPMFVPATTLLLVHLTALAMALARGGRGTGIGEVMCSLWVLLCLWPFVKGLFGKAKCGIPLSTVFKSAVLALLFVHCCTRISLPQS